MLVLTRKPNQKLNIGGDIVITVVKVRGNTIRLGIEAPKDVRVIRSELEIKTDVEPNGTASNAGDTSSESNLTNNSTDDLNGSSSANTSDNSNNAVLVSHLTGTTTGSSNMAVTQFTAMAKHDKRSASMATRLRSALRCEHSRIASIHRIQPPLKTWKIHRCVIVIHQAITPISDSEHRSVSVTCIHPEVMKSSHSMPRPCVRFARKVH